MKTLSILSATLIVFLFLSCTDGPGTKSHKLGSTNYQQDSSLHLKHHFNQTDFDLYQLSNDSLNQSAYIHYIHRFKIVFNISTYNKRTGELCELMDTATNQDVTGNLAAAEDELKNGESYGVEEFTYDRDNIHTWIGIEPRRGNRLTFYSGLDTICLKAVGTLRLASLSNTNNAARVATIIKRVNKK